MSRTLYLVYIIYAAMMLGCRGKNSNTNETVSAKEFQSVLDYWNRPNGFRENLSIQYALSLNRWNDLEKAHLPLAISSCY